jgi:hypothetical protein
MTFADVLEQIEAKERLVEIQQRFSAGIRNVAETAVTSINMVLDAEKSLAEMKKDYEAR